MVKTAGSMGWGEEERVAGISSFPVLQSPRLVHTRESWGTGLSQIAVAPSMLRALFVHRVDSMVGVQPLLPGSGLGPQRSPGKKEACA